MAEPANTYFSVKVFKYATQTGHPPTGTHLYGKVNTFIFMFFVKKIIIIIKSGSRQFLSVRSPLSAQWRLLFYTEYLFICPRVFYEVYRNGDMFDAREN